DTGCTRCGESWSRRSRSRQARRVMRSCICLRYRKPPWMSFDERDEVPEARSPFSTSSARSPRCAASSSTPQPVMPPPTITKSKGRAIPASARWRKVGSNIAAPSRLEAVDRIEQHVWVEDAGGVERRGGAGQRAQTLIADFRTEPGRVPAADAVVVRNGRAARNELGIGGPLERRPARHRRRGIRRHAEEAGEVERGAVAVRMREVAEDDDLLVV